MRMAVGVEAQPAALLAQVEPEARIEPTGILRNCSRYLKVQTADREPTEADYTERLLTLFKDYNSVGLTSICDRSASPDALNRYKKIVHDQVDHLPPLEIIADIERLESEIAQGLEELKGMLS